MGTAWAVTCYFNPMRWRSRLRNYRCFRRNLGIPLATVEWHPSGSFELCRDDADVLLQVQGGDLMWQKERLLSLALEGLPPEAESVVWLDCEILFCDPGWVDSVVEALERHTVIQPFARACYMDPEQTRAILERPGSSPRDWTPFQGGTGVVASAKLLQQEGRDALVDADLKGHLDPGSPGNGSRLPRIPGLAWAARRSTLEEVGLFDRAIIGSGDWLWMLGVLGGSERWLATARGLGYSYLARSSYPDWASKAHARVGGRIGHLEGTVLHLYHGQIAKRRYKSRHRALSDLQVDVETDIVATPEGVWKFVDPRPEWIELMRSYFLGRDEDESP